MEVLTSETTTNNSTKEGFLTGKRQTPDTLAHTSGTRQTSLSWRKKTLPQNALQANAPQTPIIPRETSLPENHLPGSPQVRRRTQTTSEAKGTNQCSNCLIHIQHCHLSAETANLTGVSRRNPVGFTFQGVSPYLKRSRTLTNRLTKITLGQPEVSPEDSHPSRKELLQEKNPS